MLNKSEVISKHQFSKIYKSPEVKRKKTKKNVPNVTSTSSREISNTKRSLWKPESVKGVRYNLEEDKLTDNITVRSSDIDEFGE